MCYDENLEESIKSNIDTSEISAHYTLASDIIYYLTLQLLNEKGTNDRVMLHINKVAGMLVNFCSHHLCYVGDSDLVIKPIDLANCDKNRIGFFEAEIILLKRVAAICPTYTEFYVSKCLEFSYRPPKDRKNFINTLTDSNKQKACLVHDKINNSFLPQLLCEL